MGIAGSHSVVSLKQIAEARYREVNAFADLPNATLFPGEIYVVKSPTGLMITLNLKRAGLYISDGSVWTRLGTLQDQFSTAKFVIYDDTDNTKKLVVDVTNIATGTTRTLIMPDADVDLADVNAMLSVKAGVELVGVFAGNPKKATVTFSTAFADTNYSPQLVCETISDASFVPCVESVLAGSFVINMTTNNISNLTSVRWTVTKHGESN